MEFTTSNYKSLFIVALIVFLFSSCIVTDGRPTSSEEATPGSPSPQERSEMRAFENYSVNYNFKSGDVQENRLNYAGFKSFLQNTTIDILLSNSYTIAIYRKDDENIGQVESDLFFEDKHSLESMKSGVFRMGVWPVYIEFIDYMNNIDNFKKVLQANEIEENILHVSVITHSEYREKNERPVPGNYPIMCIWIKTDKGDYFMEYKWDENKAPSDTEFTYSFYSLEEYKKKWASK